MSITHSTVKVSGDRGYADDWNADHVVTDESKPKNFTTLIVAASDSLDTTRADYVCDGVDDQDEINAAISALPVQGGRVSLLEGTYQTTSEINISKDNVSIEGLGRATTIQTTITSGHIITAQNRKGILISNIHFLGFPDLNCYCLWFGNVTDSIINHCWFDSFWGPPIYFLTTCCNNLIHGNIFENNKFNSNIFILGSSNYNTISNNLSSNCESNGLNLQGSNCIVINNNFSNSSNGNGIYMVGSNKALIANNQINHNCLCGIRMSQCNDVIISGNMIYDNDQTGLVNWDGILLFECDYCIITGNSCRSNRRYEINISDAGSDLNLVHGNICVDGHLGAINDAGTGTVLADNIT